MPSYPPADSMMKAIAEAAMQPDTGFYTPVRGLPELRQALADYRRSLPKSSPTPRRRSGGWGMRRRPPSWRS